MQDFQHLSEDYQIKFPTKPHMRYASRNLYVIFPVFKNRKLKDLSVKWIRNCGAQSSGSCGGGFVVLVTVVHAAVAERCNLTCKSFQGKS